jgi:hypothetical protein
MKKRIGNLEFRPAAYLLPKEKWPKNPSWHIDYWYPNGYYGKESEFIKEGDWYIDKNIRNCRIHKDCFKNPESCMAIASFDYNDGYYELRYVSDRPLSLNKEEREIFWTLVEYGYKCLNKEEDEE